jgi:hypothetical protein
MDTATLKTKIADLAPRVAAFVSRNRAPRPLSADERRLAVTDPQAFDALARKLQDETLEDLRAEAAHEVLQEDLALALRADEVKRLATLETERGALLQDRFEAAAELDAATSDMDKALGRFMDLNARISAIDRLMGEPDKHRASIGLVALAIKRSLYQLAPHLYRAMRLPAPPSGTGRTLSDMFSPAADPFE